MIRVEDGEWSEKFPIDVAGSDGVVVCRYKGQIYQVIIRFIIYDYRTNSLNDINVNYVISFVYYRSEFTIS